MSEAKAPSIDPRFDPRFQRGYVPDAAGPAAAGSVAARPAPSPTAVPTPSSEVEPTVGVAPIAVEVATLASEIHPAAAPTAEPQPDPGPEPVFAALIDPADDSSGITPWFMAGWGVSVIAAVVGVALWWAGVATESFYGPTNESERWLQVIGWSVAPALIEGGSSAWS